MMSGWTWLRIGAILAAVGVAVGAFGAHGLRGRLDRDVEQGSKTRAEADRALEVYETGVKYHLAHALGLIAVGLVGLARGRGGSVWNASGILMTAGIVLFSGSLYLLAVTGIRWLGAITPLGGVGFILGWLALAWAASGKP
jgi:uncharacterized membrane protein YgdD (TMEM256/DUF423 family)